jgi:protein-L-isoaspartate(D-aspartate) O-methyltransferase
MTDDLFAERLQMVESQMRHRGIKDERVLSAFEQVPRHLFVPDDMRHAAYRDMPLPIGHDQTISQPYIVALMTSLLELHGDEHVLEIGTGSGYQAAILGKLAAQVETVELVPELGQAAERLLQELGYSNVHVHISDGSLGWPDAAPYPAILAAAAAPNVPQPLLDQLSDGGRLVLPVEFDHQQLLKVYTRHGHDYDQRVITAVAFVPLRGVHGWG